MIDSERAHLWGIPCRRGFVCPNEVHGLATGKVSGLRGFLPVSGVSPGSKVQVARFRGEAGKVVQGVARFGGASRL